MRLPLFDTLNLRCNAIRAANAEKLTDETGANRCQTGSDSLSIKGYCEYEQLSEESQLEVVETLNAITLLE